MLYFTESVKQLILCLPLSTNRSIVKDHLACYNIFEGRNDDNLPRTFHNLLKEQPSTHVELLSWILRILQPK